MRITLGVSGGVAAYKAAELARLLQQEGFSVEVVMTRAAREFVTPLTFAALTGKKVITDLFGDSSTGEANFESAIEHIAVAQRTDLLVVAPATADISTTLASSLDAIRRMNPFFSRIFDCVVTKDGSLSAHFEHTVAVGTHGPEILSDPGDE